MARDVQLMRLAAQHLSGSPLASPSDVVRHFAAVQSQDYIAARWALAMRSGGSTATEVDRAFDSGLILRTHVMRPTWHFVAPSDVRWLLQLTGSRVRTAFGQRFRQMGISTKTVAACIDVFVETLRQERFSTRAELAAALRARKLPGRIDTMAHLLGAAELDMVIVSGPRRGAQFTYALFDERAAPPVRFDRDAALRQLALRYFSAHGPAQLRDFVWWSGLTVSDARSAVQHAAEQLQSVVSDGVDHWMSAEVEPPRGRGLVHLLPNFDELSVGYAVRASLEDGIDIDPAVFAFSSALSNIITVDGRVRGAWRRSASQRGVRIEVRLPLELSANQRHGIIAAAQRYEDHLGVPVSLLWR